MTPTTTSAAGDGDGRPMDLRRIGFAGHRREQALKTAEAELDAIVDELLAAGPRANISLAANLAGVARTTLYRRLEDERAKREETAA